MSAVTARAEQARLLWRRRSKQRAGRMTNDSTRAEICKEPRRSNQSKQRRFTLFSMSTLTFQRSVGGDYR